MLSEAAPAGGRARRDGPQTYRAHAIRAALPLSLAAARVTLRAMTRALSFLLVAATLAFGLAPLLTPDFGGFEPQQFPIPQTDPPVQPAGYAFSIWSVIYLWLLAGAAFQLWRRADDPDWDGLRWPLTGSVAVGAVWLSVAFVSPAWATVLIWVMWAGAVLALVRAPDFDLRWAEGPVGLYAGWLTAASCVALGLMAAGYGGMNDVLAAWLSLALALGLALWVLRLRPQAWTFAAAFVWALFAVMARNWGVHMSVVALAGAAIAVIGLALYLQRGMRERV